ncbi:transmembrane protein 65 isoform X3 [Copidosoma floridanum]|uniref:transmembrane protein 65 isoform X3 n=1 Tax=Copidosoma floridanum TaxID=29053 RepID=UPI0006C9ADBA|nr:transmembrane protein 65 isoform X3 [Copidosoma floridanum]
MCIPMSTVLCRVTRSRLADHSSRSNMMFLRGCSCKARAFWSSMTTEKCVLRQGSYNNQINDNNSGDHCQKRAMGSASAAVTSGAIPGVLTKKQAKELAVRLTPDERQVLIAALQECQFQKIKAEYEVDLPEAESLETVPQPTKGDLMRVSVANAIPFIGFGFLDNSIMIIAGDSIEATLGAFISLTTMAAAAFGNTISDILGIGSAYYVELLAQRIGFQPPKLTPIQLDLPKSRRAANMGRVIGVTIGCLLGMSPLLFLHKETKEQSKDDEVEEKKEDNKTKKDEKK